MRARMRDGAVHGGLVRADALKGLHGAGFGPGVRGLGLFFDGRGLSGVLLFLGLFAAAGAAGLGARAVAGVVGFGVGHFFGGGLGGGGGGAGGHGGWWVVSGGWWVVGFWGGGYSDG